MIFKSFLSVFFKDEGVHPGSQVGRSRRIVDDRFTRQSKIGNNRRRICPMICPECRKVFTDRAAFTRHRNVEHFRLLKVCMYCQESFKRKYILTAHMLKVHGVDK